MSPRNPLKSRPSHPSPVKSRPSPAAALIGRLRRYPQLESTCSQSGLKAARGAILKAARGAIFEVARGGLKAARWALKLRVSARPAGRFHTRRAHCTLRVAPSRAFESRERHAAAQVTSLYAQRTTSLCPYARAAHTHTPFKSRTHIRVVTCLERVVTCLS